MHEWGGNGLSFNAPPGNLQHERNVQCICHCSDTPAPHCLLNTIQPQIMAGNEVLSDCCIAVSAPLIPMTAGYTLTCRRCFASPRLCVRRCCCVLEVSGGPRASLVLGRLDRASAPGAAAADAGWSSRRGMQWVIGVDTFRSMTVTNVGLHHTNAQLVAVDGVSCSSSQLTKRGHVLLDGTQGRGAGRGKA